MLNVITRHLNALSRLRILKAGKKIVVGFKLQFINQVHVRKKLIRKEALKRINLQERRKHFPPLARAKAHQRSEKCL